MIASHKSVARIRFVRGFMVFELASMTRPDGTVADATGSGHWVTIRAATQSWWSWVPSSSLKR
jgi:hypothetical protein